jgi:hypothetical protein
MEIRDPWTSLIATLSLQGKNSWLAVKIPYVFMVRKARLEAFSSLRRPNLVIIKGFDNGEFLHQSVVFGLPENHGKVVQIFFGHHIVKLYAFCLSAAHRMAPCSALGRSTPRNSHSCVHRPFTSGISASGRGTSSCDH